MVVSLFSRKHAALTNWELVIECHKSISNCNNNMFFKKKKKGMAEYITKRKTTRFFLLAPSEIPLANHPSRYFPCHSYQHNIMGSSLASVTIVNVRLCRDAFKGRFREGVCTNILVGVVRGHFCHCLHNSDKYVAHWCTKFGL